MTFFDYIFAEWKRYRRWRGGVWIYASSPDGGWIRQQSHWLDFPRVEDYR